MKKSDVVQSILQHRWQKPPVQAAGNAFAPTNIALCKYWGKRNQELNLPVTSSLSISLGDKGASVNLAVNQAAQDKIILNDHVVDSTTVFSRRLVDFLNLFRPTHGPFFDITVHSTIPIAAGLASSACGFASIVKASDVLYGWDLSETELSILARLGSGSASRSVMSGFVEWHAGIREDGFDSHAELLSETWSELCVGLLIMSQKDKGLSSREAMQRTVATSVLYSVWPQQVSRDLVLLKQAIMQKDFELLGKTAEANAMSMHATMLSAWPPVSYAIPETVVAMQKVWSLRQAGLSLYFTQDAGPNLKLLFLQNDLEQVKAHFPTVEIIQPFLA